MNEDENITPEINPPERPASTVEEDELAQEMPGGREAHDPYAAFRFPDYRLYAIGGMINATGNQMRGVAVGWELYERTKSPLALGLVGLVQVLPVILLVLPAGHIADNYARKRTIMCAQFLLALVSFGLMAVSNSGASVNAMYALLGMAAVIGALAGPSYSAMLPHLVPPSAFANAVTWDSTRWQVASTFGPALGGVLIGIFHKAAPVYLIDAVSSLLFLLFVAGVRGRPIERRPREKATLHDLLAGFRFIRSRELIFATVTLDMLAVFFGGATALLPIFAKDVLHTGPEGLGWLRAAPAVGAFCMAICLAHLPPMKHAGRAMLWSVAGFGAATVAFGLSKNFYFSMLCLFLTGMFDNISVVVRHTLVQLLTPDEMRGRVSAANSVFIGASNELGEFESGVVAARFSHIVAVVAGGIGTILVVLFTAWRYPSVPRLKRLTVEGANENNIK